MVGCTAKFNFRSARSKLFHRQKICSEKIKANKAAFQLELNNRFAALDINENDINEVNNNITSAIRETAVMIGSISANKESKYSGGTMALIKKRINIQVNTQRDEIERAELNKLINKRRREEKRKKNLDLVEETIQNGKTLK